MRSAKRDFIETIHVKHNPLRMVHYLIVSFSSYGNIILFHRKKYIYQLNLQLLSKYISGNVKALDHKKNLGKKRPQIKMSHSFIWFFS